MLFSDTLLLLHAADHTDRVRAEADLRSRIVAAHRSDANGARRHRRLSVAPLRARLARTLAALAERLEPQASTPRLDRGSGSAARG